MNLEPEVEAMLAELVPGIQSAIGPNLLGVYLRGSLALGDFDPVTSDLDFLVVTEKPLSEGEYSALMAMHTRLATLPNYYAHRLEGSYIDRLSLRDFRPGERQYPTLRTDFPFGLDDHKDNWIFEWWTVREHGVNLVGPDPRTLIDPISDDDLVAAAEVSLVSWLEWTDPTKAPAWMTMRNYQAFVVETMCRALYTIEHGRLSTKPVAVAWALRVLPEPWRSLVERGQSWRGDETCDAENVPEVTAFIRHAAARASR